MASNLVEYLESWQHELDINAPPPYEKSTMPVPARVVESPLNKSTIDFRFYSSLPFTIISEQTWEARLEVRARDIPSLMRNGFYWNEQNIEKGRGQILEQRDFPNSRLSRGLVPQWTWGRQYLLTDLSRDPQWTAELWIFSNEVKILPIFSVGNLGFHNLFEVAAYIDGSNKRVYTYMSSAKMLNINMIYDEIALEGWWPWPKKDESSPLLG